jgi:hypothetical protein
MKEGTRSGAAPIAVVRAVEETVVPGDEEAVVPRVVANPEEEASEEAIQEGQGSEVALPEEQGGEAAFLEARR